MLKGLRGLHHRSHLSQILKIHVYIHFIVKLNYFQKQVTRK